MLLYLHIPPIYMIKSAVCGGAKNHTSPHRWFFTFWRVLVESMNIVNPEKIYDMDSGLTDSPQENIMLNVSLDNYTGSIPNNSSFLIFKSRKNCGEP